MKNQRGVPILSFEQFQGRSPNLQRRSMGRKWAIAGDASAAKVLQHHRTVVHDAGKVRRTVCGATAGTVLPGVLPTAWLVLRGEAHRGGDGTDEGSHLDARLEPDDQRYQDSEGQQSGVHRAGQAVLSERVEIL